MHTELELVSKLTLENLHLPSLAPSLLCPWGPLDGAIATLLPREATPHRPPHYSVRLVDCPSYTTRCLPTQRHSQPHCFVVLDNPLNLTPIPDTKMENPCVEQFISSLAQSLKPGYPELIRRLNFSEYRLATQWQVWCADHSQRPIVNMLASKIAQANQPWLSEQSSPRKGPLRAQNACLLYEVQMAYKKAICYLEVMHSEELDFCSHKEELLRLRSQRLAPPQSNPMWFQ